MGVKRREPQPTQTWSYPIKAWFPITYKEENDNNGKMKSNGKKYIRKQNDDNGKK